MDRYYPALESGAARVLDVSAARGRPLGPLAGTYRGTQYSRSNYEKLKAMFNQVRVRDAGDGTLRVSPPGGAPPIRFIETGPLTFRGDSGEIVAFRRAADGGIAGFTLSGSIWDPSSWDRLGPLENGTTHALMLVAALLIVVTRLVLWPALGVIARVRRVPRTAMTDDERRWWRWSAIASALVVLAPVVGLATAFLSFQHPVVAVPRAMAALSVTLLIAIVVGLPLLWPAVLAWRRRAWSPARRVHFTLVALAFAVAAPLLAYWRLLGPPW